MASVVDICNLALATLGQEKIVALDDNTKKARLCNQFYPILRDEVLREHPWNSAMARISLAPLSTTPAYYYGYEYQQPADCLRVMKLEDVTAEHKIEGRKILAHSSTLKILYLKQITDPNEFDSMLVTTLAARIAWALALPITSSTKIQKETRADYHALLASARSIDAQEGSPEQLEADEWTNARR